MKDERTLEDYERMHSIGLPEPKDVKKMVELISNIKKLIHNYHSISGLYKVEINVEKEAV